MNKDIDLLKRGMQAFSVDLTEKQLGCFDVYLNKIQEWNKKINITAIDGSRDIVIKHFIDSLAANKYISSQDETCIDVGTGAGLPGLPIKLLWPNIEMTFVDSSQKKIRVVEDICRALNIRHYSTLAKSAEELGRNSHYRSCYDVVLTRALAPLAILLEYGLPLLKEGGKMIVYKGPTVDMEVENSSHALSVLKGRIKEKACYCLPFSDFRRTVLVVEKVGITPPDYPRNVGIPRKRPL